MIASAIQTLQGSDVHAKLETYNILSNLFKAFDQVPDRDDLSDRLDELFIAIMADLTMLSTEEALNLPLSQRALKLAGFILFDQDLSAKLNPKLGKEVMEFSLAKLEAANVPKGTATNWLWLWASQRFPRTVVTAEIAGRMLTVVGKTNYPSAVVATEKLSVISRLVDQQKDAMMRRVEEWLPYVVACLLDDGKKVREAALRCALEVGKIAHNVPHLGKAMQHLLRIESQDKPSMLARITERFIAIMSLDGDGVFVAYAWGAITTLCSSQTPEKWQLLLPWMQILRPYFQTNNAKTKVAAQSSWIRMAHYFAVTNNIIFRPKNLALLQKPIVNLLGSNTRIPVTVRKAGTETALALIYMCMRPTITSEQTTILWTELIAPIIDLFLISPSTSEKAFHLLASLFEVKPLDTWHLDKVLERNIITENEIPAIDPKWLKNNFRVIQPLLEKVMTVSDSDSRVTVWNALMKSLKLASSKEIQISAETMEVVAGVCTIVKRLWSADVATILYKSEKATISKINMLEQMITCAFESLGYSAFVDRLLTYSNVDDPMPVRSPSKFTSANKNKQQEAFQTTSAITFILNIYLNPPKSTAVDSNAIDSLERLISRACLSQRSIRKAFHLLAECLRVIPNKKEEIPIQCWKVLADTAVKLINSDKDQTSGMSLEGSVQDSEDKGHIVLNLLTWGIRNHLSEPYEEWEMLLNACSVTNAEGYRSFCVGSHISEVLAQVFIRESCYSTKHLRLVLRLARAVDEPSQQFPNLIATLGLILDRCFMEGDMPLPWQPFLDEITSFVESATQKSIKQIIITLQDAVGNLISSSAERSQGVDQSDWDAGKRLYFACLKLVCSLPKHDSDDLDRLSTLFAAGFRCEEEMVVRQTLLSWNSSFGRAQDLVYPRKFAKIVAKIKSRFDILLPSWKDEFAEIEDVSQDLDSSENPRTKESQTSLQELLSLDDRRPARRQTYSKKRGSTMAGLPEDALGSPSRGLRQLNKKRKSSETPRDTNQRQTRANLVAAVPLDNHVVYPVDNPVYEEFTLPIAESTPLTQRESKKAKRRTSEVSLEALSPAGSLGALAAVEPYSKLPSVPNVYVD